MDAKLPTSLALGEQNFAPLQAHAATIAWPLWRQVAIHGSERVAALKRLNPRTAE
ncbi:hypothetical protein Nhal_4013 (plasmid) [Nitrosococcus halophilus Nc 4]|uniref:Uncharacterized protein n=1 Tax=Nitrosococcus halophilus (strain Nc4) TaxID=472759 RepID=D5C5G7_NITHN|nr:hypothetical protein Nhal_4013 [Nitrosococcus halophilus Nc 4]